MKIQAHSKVTSLAERQELYSNKRRKSNFILKQNWIVLHLHVKGVVTKNSYNKTK